MNHLPTSILNLLGFTSSKNSSEKKRDGDEDDEGDVDLTSMVKKLVQDQHRTMFYIATLNPEIQNKTVEHSKVIAPSLKWQCASSLSKSRMLLARTNSNSNKYYTFTYMETDVDILADSSLSREELIKNRSF